MVKILSVDSVQLNISISVKLRGNMILKKHACICSKKFEENSDLYCSFYFAPK